MTGTLVAGEGKTRGGAPGPKRLVFITGMSGAGNSTALKALEDLGYEAIDNLPLGLVAPLIDSSSAAPRPIAATIDVRTRDFSAAGLMAAIHATRARGDTEVRLLYLDSDDDVLMRRFTETRRRHPLATDRPVADGIRRERSIVEPLRVEADHVLDTSLISPHDLRRLLAERFALDRTPGLYLSVQSFSFKRGLPREADLVFDVRFLDNPHWDLALRPLTGRDPPVQAMIRADPQWQTFLDGLFGLLGPLLPRYNREGKSYLTIAVGCTGGKHRSVLVAETLAQWARDAGYSIGLVHRDMPVT
jgi:UPF0042 nucleotide-binding protein